MLWYRAFLFFELISSKFPTYFEPISNLQHRYAVLGGTSKNYTLSLKLLFKLQMANDRSFLRYAPAYTRGALERS